MNKILYPFFLIAYAAFYAKYKKTDCVRSKTSTLIESAYSTVLQQSSIVLLFFLVVTKNVYLSIPLMMAYLVIYYFLVYHHKRYRPFFAMFMKKRYKLLWLNTLFGFLFGITVLFNFYFVKELI